MIQMTSSHPFMTAITFEESSSVQSLLHHSTRVARLAQAQHPTQRPTGAVVYFDIFSSDTPPKIYRHVSW